MDQIDDRKFFARLDKFVEDLKKDGFPVSMDDNEQVDHDDYDEDGDDRPL